MSDLRWAPDAAVVVMDESVVLARLPDGPIWVIQGTGADLVRQMGASFSEEGLVSWAAEAYDQGETVIRPDVRDFLTTLRSATLVLDA